MDVYIYGSQIICFDMSMFSEVPVFVLKNCVFSGSVFRKNTFQIIHVVKLHVSN